MMNVSIEVSPNETASWGRRRGIGLRRDERDRARALKDLARFESAYADCSKRLELVKLEEVAHETTLAQKSVLVDQLAYIGRLIAFTRRRLEALDDEDEQARVRVAAGARAQELRAELGVSDVIVAPAPSVQEWRETQQRSEQAALAAEHTRLTRAELDLMDPQSEAGKAKALAETNLRDASWRASHNLAPLVDAQDLYSGRVGVDSLRDPAHVVQMAEREAAVTIQREERRDLLASIRRAIR